MEKDIITPSLLTDEELKKQKRQKQLAILKASNEMLQYAKESVLNNDKLDDINRTERIKEIEQAISENKLKGETYLNATQREIENSEYGEPSEIEIERYRKRLEKKGITEEQLKQLDTATVTIGDGEDKSGKRKRKRKFIKEEETEEEIVRLDNEEELMKLTRATDTKIEGKLKENTKQLEKDKVEIIEKIDNKKVKSESKKEVVTKIENDKKEFGTIEEYHLDYDFDFSSIADYVQYDVIPLPSEGQCYPKNSPLRSGRIPVAYLTASDENLIASPNLYRDGKIIDVILERKILDKRIKPSDLCKGDRDAIVLWLRATMDITTNFPLRVRNPKNVEKQYDINVDLSQFKYKPFKLKGDKDGLFDYTTNGGDLIKFKFITFKDENKIKDALVKEYVNVTKLNIAKLSSEIKDYLNSFTEIDKEDKEELLLDAEELFEWANETEEVDYSNTFMRAITEQMIVYTVSINGNDDEDFIRKYIENMRMTDSRKYREYVNDNVPGVDFKLTVNIPKSDGGGSFDTFFRIDNTIFINV